MIGIKGDEMGKDATVARLSGSICLGTRLDCAAGTTWTKYLKVR